MAKDKEKNTALELSDKKDKKEKKDKTSEKKQPNKVAKWFKELKIEFKKVVWPSKKKVLNNTGIVLGVMVVATLFVGGLDFGLLKLFSLILGLE
jgi:preprotein translocase subunit SecE